MASDHFYGAFFVFQKTKKIIQFWNDMSVSRWNKLVFFLGELVFWSVKGQFTQDTLLALSEMLLVTM